MSGFELRLTDDSVGLHEEPLASLFAEAGRQLDVCNACRYCEGLCAVFPALERRAVLDEGDITQLANLCHDCRACYDACMYSSPHEFAVDVPLALAAVRVADYDRYVWPRRVPRALSGWTGLFFGALISACVVLAIAIAHAGWGGLVVRPDHAASPYRLIPYPALLALMLSAALFSAVVMTAAGVSYWRQIGGAPEGLNWHAVGEALKDAIALRQMRGGGEQCYYPEDTQPSGSRRRLHLMVTGGFCACLLSTVAAAVSQDLLGVSPPYRVLSVPVIAGTLGGLSLVVGCAGLLILKRRASPVTSFALMTVKDYGLLVALEFLALTGLATLLTRNTSASGVVLLIHLAALVQAFAMAPYSKFVHVVFRSVALLRDRLEQSVA